MRWTPRCSSSCLKPVDAFHASTFLHVAAGRPATVGPAWDFDIAMGNANYNRSRFLEGWMLTGRQLADRLCRDRAFLTALVARWREVRATGLVEALLRGIDRDVRRLRAAAARNFRRWPVLGRYVWSNPVDPATGRVRTTWRSEVAFLRGWLEQRAAWLDAHIGELPARGRDRRGRNDPRPRRARGTTGDRPRRRRRARLRHRAAPSSPA